MFFLSSVHKLIRTSEVEELERLRWRHFSQIGTPLLDLAVGLMFSIACLEVWSGCFQPEKLKAGIDNANRMSRMQQAIP